MLVPSLQITTIFILFLDLKTLALYESVEGTLILAKSIIFLYVHNRTEATSVTDILNYPYLHF